MIPYFSKTVNINVLYSKITLIFKIWPAIISCIPGSRTQNYTSQYTSLANFSNLSCCLDRPIVKTSKYRLSLMYGF